MSTVAAVLERDVDAVAASCNTFCRGHRWLRIPADDTGTAPDLTHAFRHTLLRQWLYARIGPVVRAQLYGKVAAALERERAAGRAPRRGDDCAGSVRCLPPQLVPDLSGVTAHLS